MLWPGLLLSAASGRNKACYQRAVSLSASWSTSFRNLTSWSQTDRRYPVEAVIHVKAPLGASLKFYMDGLGLGAPKKDLEETWALLSPGVPRSPGLKPPTFSLALQVLTDSTSKAPNIGNGFGHFGMAVPDCYAAVEHLRSEGCKVTREAGQVKGGSNVIAFCEDPSGYKTEILHRPHGVGPQPLCQVMLRVGDLAHSVAWYTEVLGMRVLRERDAPEQGYSVVFLGYGEEEESTVVELTYNYGATSYQLSPLGQGFSHLTLTTQDVKRTREHALAWGSSLLGPALPSVGGRTYSQGSPRLLPVFSTQGQESPPLELDVAGEEGVGLVDPDGHVVLLVDEGVVWGQRDSTSDV